MICTSHHDSHTVCSWLESSWFEALGVCFLCPKQATECLQPIQSNSVHFIPTVAKKFLTNIATGKQWFGHFFIASRYIKRTEDKICVPWTIAQFGRDIFHNLWISIQIVCEVNACFSEVVSCADWKAILVDSLTLRKRFRHICNRNCSY